MGYCEDCYTCRFLEWGEVMTDKEMVDYPICTIDAEDEGDDHCSKYQAKTQAQIERDVNIFREAMKVNKSES